MGIEEEVVEESHKWQREMETRYGASNDRIRANSDGENDASSSPEENSVGERRERRKLMAREDSNGALLAAGANSGECRGHQGDYSAIPAWDPVGIHFDEMEFIDIPMEGEEEV